MRQAVFHVKLVLFIKSRMTYFCDNKPQFPVSSNVEILLLVSYQDV